jgi:hypothetical protein
MRCRAALVAATTPGSAGPVDKWHFPRPLTDPGIVNDRVVRAARVGLLGDLPHARDTSQVADDDGTGRGQGRTCVLGPGCTAGMQRDRVSVVGWQPGRHQSQAFGGAGDEHA